MLGRLIFMTVSLLSSLGWAWSLSHLEGKTFSSPGPNCFSSALRATHKTPSFRGMDEKEFSAFLELNCQKVAKPAIGDIGVFTARGFAHTHAFVYLNEQWGFQKPGVDYLGKTPLATVRIQDIMYTYIASKECRQYAKDISACSVDFAYYRCQKHRPIRHILSYLHEEAIFKIEKELERVLLQSVITESDRKSLSEIKNLVEQERKRLASIPANPKELRFLYSRIISLEKQLAFMQVK